MAAYIGCGILGMLFVLTREFILPLFCRGNDPAATVRKHLKGSQVQPSRLRKPRRIAALSEESLNLRLNWLTDTRFLEYVTRIYR